ncbi:fibropellin-3-like [Haliotis rubra]|uniref:fibropellin-3-like n=1 Tax=Haliotis rubra TaxID=36100 RepID=UPI001EE50905|nr:fibropellin-3-like [Haliotis rubra]
MLISSVPAFCDSSPCLNGGTCSNNQLNFTCDCRSGFTGDMCEIRNQTCAMKDCGMSVGCIDDPVTGLSDCLCGTGYVKVEASFRDTSIIPLDHGLNINECVLCDPTGVNSCIDEINSYTCLCVQILLMVTDVKMSLTYVRMPTLALTVHSVLTTAQQLRVNVLPP